jgi:glutamate---cysteine ligase / carboxylate-amine ligase
MPASTSDHAFGNAPDFTIGVEEELLLVDVESHELSHTSSALLDRVGADERAARHDIYEAQLELSSPVCRNAGEAVAALASLRERARAAGGTMFGAGIHPAGRFGDVQLVESDRYAKEADRLRGLLGRTPDCALHVHVGMPDAETAIRVCNGLRGWIPLFEALAANSPFWHGSDSGFASARRTLRRGFPRVDIPAEFRDYADYEAAIGAAVTAGELADYTFVWWEVRPHPKFGTIELRAMDSQASLASVGALAALVHGLCKQLAEARARPGPRRETLSESSFRAGRDGLAATLHDGERLVAVPELARHALALALPHARELGSDAPLEGIERILERGNGAYRQRGAHAGGGMRAVTTLLVEETARTLV